MVAPGNHESAGKRRHGTPRKGNQHLKPVLVEAAWSAVRTDGLNLNKIGGSVLIGYHKPHTEATVERSCLVCQKSVYITPAHAAALTQSSVICDRTSCPASVAPAGDSRNDTGTAA